MYKIHIGYYVYIYVYVAIMTWIQIETFEIRHQQRGWSWTVSWQNFSPVEDLAQSAIIPTDEDVAAAWGVGPDAIDCLTHIQSRQRGESLEVVTADRVVPSTRVQVSFRLLAACQSVDYAVLTLLFVVQVKRKKTTEQKWVATSSIELNQNISRANRKVKRPGVPKKCLYSLYFSDLV